MHRPRAHISRHGAADTMSGAIPTAVSQSQPTPSPVPPRAKPMTARRWRSPIQDRTTSSGNKAVEQHDATLGLGVSPAASAEGTGSGFLISKLSIIFNLVDEPPDTGTRSHPSRARIGKVSRSQ